MPEYFAFRHQYEEKLNEIVIILFASCQIAPNKSIYEFNGAPQHNFCLYWCRKRKAPCSVHCALTWRHIWAYVGITDLTQQQFSIYYTITWFFKFPFIIIIIGNLCIFQIIKIHFIILKWAAQRNLILRVKAWIKYFIIDKIDHFNRPHFVSRCSGVLEARTTYFWTSWST